jgi:uncharacterized protein
MNDTKKNIATGRSKVKTNAKRAVYDLETIYKILDDSFLCHIGFVIDNQPFVIPTCYGRENDKIFFHGSVGSRMLKHIKAGNEICIAVSIVDGIVLARSAFHHSINYRSVIIFGKADEITDTNEKTNALKIISEHIVPGRWNDIRKPDKKELNVTSIFSFKIVEASAKIRAGGPVDDKKDMQLNIWAGVLPLKTVPGIPEKDPLLNDNIQLPGYIKKYKKNV